MNIPNEVVTLLTRLESNGFEAFVVGGCVRDSLLGKAPADWDICTSAHPEEVQALFTDHFVVPSGLKHGTVTVVSRKMNVEITTYRQDGQYLDNRHPESVTYTKSLREDLKRRDFTINAMAYSPKTGLIDYFNGRRHLEQKLLCCVGEPTTRFSEDALRILRGLRFAATYDLTIEPETIRAIHACRDRLTSISVERIFDELRKTLMAAEFAKILAEYPDILGVIFPDAREHFLFSDQWQKFMQNLSNLSPSIPLRLAAILFWFHDAKNYLPLCKSAIIRLKPDKKTLQHCMTLLECQLLPLPVTLTETRRFLGRYNTETLEEILEWRAVQLGEENIQVKEFLKEIKDKHLCCTLSELAVSGDTLQKHGLSGTDIGTALRRALNAVIEDTIPNEKEALIKFLFS